MQIPFIVKAIVPLLSFGEQIPTVFHVMSVNKLPNPKSINLLPLVNNGTLLPWWIMVGVGLLLCLSPFLVGKSLPLHYLRICFSSSVKKNHPGFASFLPTASLDFWLFLITIKRERMQPQLWQTSR